MKIALSRAMERNLYHDSYWNVRVLDTDDFSVDSVTVGSTAYADGLEFRLGRAVYTVDELTDTQLSSARRRYALMLFESSVRYERHNRKRPSARLLVASTEVQLERTINKRKPVRQKLAAGIRGEVQRTSPGFNGTFNSLVSFPSVSGSFWVPSADLSLAREIDMAELWQSAQERAAQHLKSAPSRQNVLRAI